MPSEPGLFGAGFCGGVECCCCGDPVPDDKVWICQGCGLDACEACMKDVEFCVKCYPKTEITEPENIIRKLKRKNG